MKNHGGSEKLDLLHEAYEFEKIQQTDKALMMEKGRFILSSHRNQLSSEIEKEIEANLRKSLE
jgi:hypothetical protein